jgi:glucosamine kinase
MITALLAIDVGGSTSRATLVDYSGNCLGQGRSGGGNPGSNPPDAAAAAIIAAAGAAVSEADAALDIRVAMLAVAGPRNAEVERRLNEAFRAMGLTGPMVMTGDTQAMLPSVTAALDGYCIFAGTGSGAVRVKHGEVDSVVDAVGYLIGDLGSGYWLGHHAAIAVAAALEGRGPKTALTEAVLGGLGIPNDDAVASDGRPQPLRDFIDIIYNKMRPIELAKFAPYVLAHAADPVSADLLARSGRYLLDNFRHVFDPDMPGPVVLGGSVAAHLSGLPNAVADVLREAGHAPDIHLTGDPSVGAAVLALRHEGVVVHEALRARIAASIAARRTTTQA